MSRTKQKTLILIAIMCLMIIMGICLGSNQIPIFESLNILGYKLFGMPLAKSVDQMNIAIVWQLRLPRVLLAFLVGGALAVSGSAVQSVLKNELASPYTLGVSSGASLGVGLMIVLNFNMPYLGKLSLPFIGFIGGLISIYFVMAFSSKVDKQLSNNTVILVGMVFSLFINGILTTLTGIFTEEIKAITLWQMGSFAMKGWTYVGCMIPFCVLGVLGMMRYTKEMDILTFGEEQAKIIGVDVVKIKHRLFLFASILTGAAVGLSGVIGFVDLIAPHIVRRYFGSSHKKVMPLAFITGGTLMVCTDLVARSIVPRMELPVGAITSLIGAPFFAYVYFKKRGRTAC